MRASVVVVVQDEHGLITDAHDAATFEFRLGARRVSSSA